MDKNQNEIIGINIVQLFHAIKTKIWLVIFAAFVGFTAMFSYSTFFINPTYQSSALIYVNNSSINVGSTSLSISNSDLAAAKTLVGTYIVILKSRNVLNDVIAEANLNMSYGSLLTKISAASENSTEIFRVTVTDNDPNRAELIVNTIAKILPDKIADIVDNSSVRIVDYGVVPTQKNGPSRVRYSIIGIIAGAAIAICFIISMEIMDKVIRSEQYLINNFPDIPILASIPDLSKSFDKTSYYKNNYYSSYGKDKNNG